MSKTARWFLAGGLAVALGLFLVARGVLRPGRVVPTALVWAGAGEDALVGYAGDPPRLARVSPEGSESWSVAIPNLGRVVAGGEQVVLLATIDREELIALRSASGDVLWRASLGKARKVALHARIDQVAVFDEQAGFFESRRTTDGEPVQAWNVFGRKFWGLLDASHSWVAEPTNETAFVADAAGKRVGPRFPVHGEATCTSNGKAYLVDSGGILSVSPRAVSARVSPGECGVGDKLLCGARGAGTVLATNPAPGRMSVYIVEDAPPRCTVFDAEWFLGGPVVPWQVNLRRYLWATGRTGDLVRVDLQDLSVTEHRAPGRDVRWSAASPVLWGIADNADPHLVVATDDLFTLPVADGAMLTPRGLWSLVAGRPTYRLRESSPTPRPVGTEVR